MRALITGASGFVGGYLGRHLAAAGHAVVGGVLSSDLDSINLSTLPYQCEVCDVTVPEQCKELFNAFEPEVVFHLAGIAFVPAAAKDFLNTLRVNVLGVHSVCQAAASMDRPIKVLLASSGEVYGAISPEDLPIDEDTPVRPNNPYSLSKQMAEQALTYFSRKSQIEGYILRPFNHIGPGQHESFVTASFASQLAQIAAGKREPVLHVGNLEASRDFMDVRDVVRAYSLVVNRPGGLYNLSSGTSVSIQAVLDILLDISGLDVEVKQDPDRMRPSEVPEIRGCFDKAFRSFGWKPEIDIETSLRDIYKYWQGVYGA